MQQEESICRICLNSSKKTYITQENESFQIQMLQLCVPELDIIATTEFHLCNTCLNNIKEIYEFKIRCLQTEEKLRCYLENCCPEKIEMKYILEFISNCEPTENMEICRICLNLSENFLYLNEENVFIANMFSTCISEMDLNLFNNSIICEGCVAKIKSFYSFKTESFDVEEKLNNFRAISGKNMVDLKELLHKKQTTCNYDDVKQEIDKPEYICINELNIKLENNTDNLYIKEETNFTPIIKKEIVEINNEEEENKDASGKLSENVNPIKCDVQPMYLDMDQQNESNDMLSLPERVVMLSQSSVNPLGEGLKWYNCKFCSYHTKWKAHLERHSQIHLMVMLNKTKSYRCRTCNFTTKYKHALSKHYTLEHGPWLKCDKCDYQTKWTRCFNTHVLSHKGTSLFKCEICGYNTKWKHHLKRHMFVHEEKTCF